MLIDEINNQVTTWASNVCSNYGCYLLLILKFFILRLKNPIKWNVTWLSVWQRFVINWLSLFSWGCYDWNDGSFKWFQNVKDPKGHTHWTTTSMTPSGGEPTIYTGYQVPATCFWLEVFFYSSQIIMTLKKIIIVISFEPIAINFKKWICDFLSLRFQSLWHNIIKSLYLYIKCTSHLQIKSFCTRREMETSFSTTLKRKRNHFIWATPLL